MLFVDQITFSSLLRVLALGRSLQTIWHFEPIAPLAQRLLRVFRRLGLIRAEVRQIEHHIGQVRNDAGESEYVRLFGLLGLAADGMGAMINVEPMAKAVCRTFN